MPEISIVVERRGRKEDNKLLNYYNGLRNRGTKWVAADRLRARIRDFGFNNKKDNVIGLQIADLIAYPVIIHLLYPERCNPSYEVVKHNIFQDKGVLLVSTGRNRSLKSLLVQAKYFLKGETTLCVCTRWQLFSPTAKF